MNQEEKTRWMLRAMQLAKLGSAGAAPNPLVGCVVVHPEKGLIGEGWHQKFGSAHAEVHALAQVKQPELLRESTVLVNLEPCAHFGKTPPCCELLIANQVAGVVISNKDPNPLVAGKGIQAIINAGIRVESGLLEEEGRMLNRFFFTAQEKRRPFVTLKWAQTADGFIAPEDKRPIWISSEQSRLLVHRLRAEHQGILAGRNTIRNDNPQLNLRNWPGRQPVRIVADPDLSLPNHLNIFKNSESPTWIINNQKEGIEAQLHFLKTSHPDDLTAMLDVLFSHGIHSLLVEGGAQLLSRFLEAGLWDEALVFTGSASFEKGIRAPEINCGQKVTSRRFDSDLLDVYRPF